MNLIHLFKICTIFSMGIQPILFCQEESFNQQFKDEIITTSDNFSEKYPQLDTGFQLIHRNFQRFMLNRLVGHNAHEKIFLVDGQIASRLDNAIMQAEAQIIISMKKPFCSAIFDAIENNIDIHQVTDPAFLYVFQADFLEQQIPFYINDYTNDNDHTLLIAATQKNNQQIVDFLINIAVTKTLAAKVFIPW